MFTVKFLKNERTAPINAPAATEAVMIREASAVHIRYEPYHAPSDTAPRIVVQLGDAPGETLEVTVGDGHQHCQYSIAYIMNSAGKTVETIR